MKIFTLANIKWTHKLPGMLVCSALVATLAVGISGFIAGTENIRELSASKLQALQATRVQALEEYLESIDQDLRIIAASPMTHQALREFQQAWQALGGGQTQTLQRLYIEGNPNPAGAKENLDFSADGSAYSAVHKRFHPWFRHFLRERGYYDIFLFDLDGNLVYSVFKENDFATNLDRGAWKDTDLGKAFRAGRDAQTAGELTFFDFKAYAPSSGVPASFIATPIFDDAGIKIGVLAYQMPIHRIDQVMQSTAGLGDTGESFLVGADYLMRSDSRFSEESTILSKRFDSDTVRLAIRGESGMAYSADEAGLNNLVAYSSFKFHGSDWAIITRQATSEIFAPIEYLRNGSVIWGFATIVVVGVLGILFSRGLSRPLKMMATSIDALARGNQNVTLPNLEAKDEIGQMARSLAQVQELSQRAGRAQSALGATSAAIAMTDADFNIVYCNPALIETVRRTETYWRERIPGFSADTLIGRSIDVFHKNPAMQRSRLTALRGRHEAEISFGDYVAGLDISSIDDESGKGTGYVVQWIDLTAQRAAESQIEAVIAAAKAGDFSTLIDVTSDESFINAVATGINDLSGNVNGFLKDIDQALSGLSQGDLRSTVHHEYGGQLGEIAQRVDLTAQEIDRLVGQIIGSTSDINRASGEISQGATDLSTRAESQAASLEETAAAMEEIAATVKTNAENALQAKSLASSTQGQAERGREVVAETVHAMTNIRESAAEISDIVSTIEAIAFQTNLLALNAAVEAARAGDAGKGFAVVASEVRTLAQRSGEAAKTIKVLIGKSTDHVAAGDHLVGATDAALTEILEGVRNVARTIEEIADASREQTTGVEEVSITVSQMDEMTQQNAAMADRSAAAARSLTEQSETLVELVRFFTTRDAPGANAGAKSEPNRDQRNWDHDAKVDTKPIREPVRMVAPVPRPAAPANGTWGEF